MSYAAVYLRIVQSELVLRPSPRKWFVILAACFVFAVGGVVAIPNSPVIGSLTICLFVLGIAVSLINLVPGASYLRLSADGIEQRSMGRIWRLEWKDIESVLAYRNPTSRSRMVGIQYRSEYRSTRRGSGAARALAGVDAALADTYGMTADQLAAVMNEWLVASRGG